jgi:hypothetical protein
MKWQCPDGLPNWLRLPYPISGMGALIVRTLPGKVVEFNAEQCLVAFRRPVDQAANGTPLSLTEQNLLDFEALSRKDIQQTRDEAISQGISAYGFSKEQFQSMKS